MSYGHRSMYQVRSTFCPCSYRRCLSLTRLAPMFTRFQTLQNCPGRGRTLAPYRYHLTVASESPLQSASHPFPSPKLPFMSMRKYLISILSMCLLPNLLSRFWAPSQHVQIAVPPPQPSPPVAPSAEIEANRDDEVCLMQWVAACRSSH